MASKANAVDLLGSVMGPLGRCLSAESARRILALRTGGGPEPSEPIGAQM